MAKEVFKEIFKSKFQVELSARFFKHNHLNCVFLGISKQDKGVAIFVV